ncbi:hypothetical protein [Palleronia rufa]|uniref:hypothetical protein n=1 Tax=Palleronia rufa TaxID=1530186 RepID=UPI0039F08AC3
MEPNDPSAAALRIKVHPTLPNDPERRAVELRHDLLKKGNMPDSEDARTNRLFCGEGGPRPAGVGGRLFLHVGCADAALRPVFRTQS